MIRGEKKIFAFFGPPGSGKGTLAGKCLREAGIPVLSTGNLCRQHVEAQTEFGRQFQSSLAEGKLIPDTLITEMVIDWIKSAAIKSPTLILDGFPRTKAQAILLQDFLLKAHQEFILIPVVFDITDTVLVSRLTNRYVCSNTACQLPYSEACPPVKQGVCDQCSSNLAKRADDTSAIAMQRITTYREHAEEVVSYFKQKNAALLTLFCDDKSPAELFEAFYALAAGQVLSQ